MRFMMIVKANKETEAGVLPSKEMIETMDRFNQELINAGVFLDGAGLQPSSKGARVSFSGGKPTVTDGPFTEAKELIAGYWIIQAKSLEEAIAWARRCPPPQENGQGELELRPLYEVSDFPEETVSPEIRAREEEWVREQQRNAPKANR